MILAIVAAHLLTAALLAWHFQFPIDPSPWVSLVFFAACYTILIAPRFLWSLAEERPESPFAFVRKLLHRSGAKERAMLALPALLAASVFLPTFSSLKSAIPTINAFALDPLFMRMDLALHGGHPWKLLQPLLGYPVVSFAINGIYHLWLAAFYLTFCWVAAWRDDLELRRRFLIAFFLCWALLGNLAAIVMPSVGPCFYGLFYDTDPYADLMSYLHQADQVLPLAALDVQAELARWARTAEAGLGRGISAMPSLHVSVACLLMLLSWKMNRWIAVAGTLFLIAILLGSVHLGYHYAIDGYFSLIATPLIWWGSRFLARLAAPTPQAFASART